MLRFVKTLPFDKVVHKVATLDAQPSNENGGIMVMVTGQLLVRITRTPDTELPILMHAV